jgi:hypothetical protein
VTHAPQRHHRQAAATLTQGRLAQRWPTGAALPPRPLQPVFPGPGAHHRRTDPRPAAPAQVPQGDHPRGGDQALGPEAQVRLADVHSSVETTPSPANRLMPAGSNAVLRSTVCRERRTGRQGTGDHPTRPAPAPAPRKG